MSKQIITIYTDGACSGNPGKGGYGAVILSEGGRVELSGGYRLTTNNRMELVATIKALEALEFPSVVTLFSDSRYIVDAINLGWVDKWRKNSWYRNKKDKAVNVDLWVSLLQLCEKHDVTFTWVKAHAGNEENECCDRLAVKAASQVGLPPDTVYEKTK